MSPLKCANSFHTNEHVCRAPNADCDVAEKCTGNSVICPPDIFADSNTVCR